MEWQESLVKDLVQVKYLDKGLPKRGRGGGRQKSVKGTREGEVGDIRSIIVYSRFQVVCNYT